MPDDTGRVEMAPTPSAIAFAVASALIAGVIGFFVGQGYSIGFFRTKDDSLIAGKLRNEVESFKTQRSSLFTKSEDNNENRDEHDGSSDNVSESGSDTIGIETETDDLGSLSSFNEYPKEEYKMVLVVRTDLGMSKGKIAAQCSHATLACYRSQLVHGLNSSSVSSKKKHTLLFPEYTPVLGRWEAGGQTKIALQTNKLEHLYELQAIAISLGLSASIIIDAGRTEIEPGSATVLGIGPGPKSIINEVTGHLKLL